MTGNGPATMPVFGELNCRSRLHLALAGFMGHPVGMSDKPYFAEGGIIENDPGPHGDSVPAILGGCDYVLPASAVTPELKVAFRANDSMHHEGSTCTFCGKPDVCGHPIIRGCAMTTAAPWVPNVFVKSCQGPLG
jgi:hypothetical protein